MQDEFERLIGLLNLQFECVCKLREIAEEEYELAIKEDVDSIFPLLSCQKEFSEKCISVMEEIKELLDSTGFATIEEFASFDRLSAAQRGIFDNTLRKLRDAIKGLTSIQDKAIQLLKEKRDSIKKELDNLYQGRKLIERYYKTPKGIAPRFFDKKR